WHRQSLRARECLCQPREGHHSPTSAATTGWLRAAFCLGLSLLCFLCWEGTSPNLLNARAGGAGDACRGLRKKLVNCWPHEHTVVTMSGALGEL
ncbi:unnamed protein product, partial [Prunus brigantina]